MDKIWYKFLNSTTKFGSKFLDCAQGKVTTAGIQPPFVDTMPHQLTYQHNLPELYKIWVIAYQEFVRRVEVERRTQWGPTTIGVRDPVCK